MHWIWALLLFVILLIIIVGIVLLVVFLTGNNNSSSNGKTCASQSDCGAGYVCVNNGGSQRCRAGLGTSCSVDSDCATNLICQLENGSKVCVAGVRNPSSNKVTFPTPQGDAPEERQPTQRFVTDPVNSTVVKPLPRDLMRKRIVSLSSSDDEVNSSGSRDDLPFDVRSGSTIDSREDEPRVVPERALFSPVSTPYQERNGAYYCRDKKNGESSPVIDVCSYSNATVFLLADGNTIVEVKDNKTQRYRASNNITLTRIISYDGYMFGLSSSGELHTLSNNHFTTPNWIWNKTSWAPTSITFLSTTHDSTHLWLQAGDVGYLYGPNHVILSQQEYMGVRRIMGKNKDIYLEINEQTSVATSHPSGATFNNVFDAALNYYGEVMAINNNDQYKYRAVRIVNWNPYYIRI
jgi:hypothetical protein